MADQDTVRGLLQGAFDTHIHSSPDVLPRKFDDLDLIKRAVDAGMSGFVLKSHYICTADRATLLRQLFPGVRVFGGIVLNNSVGGLNPHRGGYRRPPGQQSSVAAHRGLR